MRNYTSATPTASPDDRELLRDDLAAKFYIFQERCEARAYLVEIGDLALHEAVDGLQCDAEFNGLVDAIGQDAVQAVLAAAFGGAR